ncbi:MAG TPA: biopolymer transporter ExbD [Chthoniobacteraceae bacterium]|jgi:biopolymer transport protein ExbD|nr:biopolymer transporter ExbD [Chthoniobacteraceae bacterium]
MSNPHSPAARRAALRQIPEEDPEFQIAPMIDILLVLLVFFMSISSTEVLQTNDHVSLPVAKDAKEKDKKGDAAKGQKIINVLWDPLRNGGAIDMDERTYGLPSDLIPELSRALTVSPNARILVRADKQVRYEYMKQLLKAIGQAGGSNLTFSVVDKEKPK